VHGRRPLTATLVVLLVGAALAVGPAVGQQSTDTQSLATDSHESLDCEFPIEVEDTTGETVTIEEEPTEVVALYPNVAQHLWEIGAQENVVGMPVYERTAYLNGSEQRTHVLGPNNFAPDTETIVDLEADIVLAPNVTQPDPLAELRDAGETVYHYPLATDFEDVMTLVERTGQLVGECEAARNVTADMADTISLVENATAGVDRPAVFYDLGDEPVGPVTVNSDAFEHEVLTTAGAENIAAGVEGGAGYPQVSTEFIVEQNPEVVVTPGESTSSFPGYNETTAMQNDDVIVVNSNLISQHAPRTVDVLEALAEELHPEAIEQARQDQTDGETDGSNNSDDNAIIDNGSDSNENESADGNGAGLTALAPAVALVALALLARRRRS